MLPNDCYLTEEQKLALKQIAQWLDEGKIPTEWALFHTNKIARLPTVNNEEVEQFITALDTSDFDTFVDCGLFRYKGTNKYTLNKAKIIQVVENNFGEPKNQPQQVKSTMPKFKGLETIHWEFLSVLATAHPVFLTKHNEQDYYIKPELNEDDTEIVGFDGFAPEFYPPHKEQLNIHMSDFVKLVPLYIRKARQGNYYLNADKIEADVKAYQAFLNDDTMISPAPAFECDVFVVMPFRDMLNPIYETVILPLQNELSIVIRRGDDSQRPSQAIMERVWQYLYACQIVIVDCTEVAEKPNGNVYYELGIADALSNAEVILISQTPAEKLPFDIRHREIIHYEDNARGINQLKENLKNAIQSILEDENS